MSMTNKNMNWNDFFLLKPAGKDYLWGGTELKKNFGKNLDLNPLAETWECSSHPEGPSIIESGVFKGSPLTEVLEQHAEWIGTHPRCKSGLPILVKFIDANKDLSIQVHPDDNYALTYENQLGKTEMWYVIDAKPGASLIYGFSEKVTPQTLLNSIEKNTLLKHLKTVPVKKGDVFFIQPGTIHAIGAGVLIAEIQESSNVTYRVFDYNRKDPNGNVRPLHINQALHVLNYMESTIVKQHSRVMRYTPNCYNEIICRCKYFQVEKVIVRTSYYFEVSQNSFQVLLCLEGEGNIVGKNNSGSIKKGDCIFIPANAGIIHIIGNVHILKIVC